MDLNNRKIKNDPPSLRMLKVTAADINIFSTACKIIWLLSFVLSTIIYHH